MPWAPVSSAPGGLLWGWLAWPGKLGDMEGLTKAARSHARLGVWAHSALLSLTDGSVASRRGGKVGAVIRRVLSSIPAAAKSGDLRLREQSAAKGSDLADELHSGRSLRVFVRGAALIGTVWASSLGEVGSALGGATGPTLGLAPFMVAWREASGPALVHPLGLASSLTVILLSSGLALLWSGSRASKRLSRFPSPKLALVHALVILVAVLGLWRSLKLQQEREIRYVVSSQTRHYRRLLLRQIEEQILLVRGWAAVLPPSGVPQGDEKQWLEAVLNSQPSIVGLGVLHVDCQSAWQLVKPAYRGLLNRPWGYDAETCQHLGRWLRTHPHELLSADWVPGTHDFQIIVPLGADSKRYLVALVDATKFFDAALAQTGNEFRVAVYGDGQLLYSTRGRVCEDPVELRFKHVLEQRYDDTNFRLEVCPSAGWIASLRSNAPDLLLGMGVVLALIIGINVYLAQTAVGRAREAQMAQSAALGLLRERDRVREELNRLFLLSPDLLWVANRRGELRELNPAWERVLNLPIRQLRERRLFDLVHPEDRGRLERCFDRLSSEETLTDIEARLVSADGSERWLLWAMTASAETGLIYGVAVDITERQRAERALEEYARELRRANVELKKALAAARSATEAKSRFLALVSHELRTPLNGILGMNELLLGTSLTEEQRQYALTIRQSTESLLSIVNDLLDSSKIEAGRMTLEQVRFNLSEQLREIAALVQPQVRAKGLELRCEFDQGLPDSVVGDPGRLRQVLLNLLANAVKFTDAGWVALRAAPLWENMGKIWVRFEVEDTGIGIPQEYHQQIFEEFVQVDSSVGRRYGGTGLGLSITKRLVELMGGQIGLRSTRGEGSLFWVELPFDPARSEKGLADEERADSAGPTRPLRVLVVEDNEVNRVVARRLLEKLGCEVTVAEGGAQALEILQREAIDLVLMDVNMPGMDGFATTRAIRSLSGTASSVKIVAMTARATADGDNEWREAGMDGWVSKPVSLEALRRVLEQWGGVRASQRPS